MTIQESQNLEHRHVEIGKGTQQRILDSVVAVINDHGERAVRVQDVAQAAGVTKPSVYHFFGSREGLIEAAQAERYRRDIFIFSIEVGNEVKMCATREEFYDLARRLLIAASDPQRDVFVRRRVEILGSAMTRPFLQEKLAVAQGEIDEALASALMFAQEMSWIPHDLDLRVFSTWLSGQLNGRVLLTLHPGRVNRSVWTKLFIDGVLAVLGDSASTEKHDQDVKSGGAHGS